MTAATATHSRRTIPKSGRTGAARPDDATRRPAAGQDPVKRRQIIDGAGRVFATRGFDAASMNDIAEEAAVSKGTLYVYFPKNEQLFVALMHGERERFAHDLFEGVEDEPDIEAALLRLGRRIPRLTTQPRIIKAQRVVIGVSERMPELAASFYAAGPKCTALRLAALLEAHAAAGTLAMDNAFLAAVQFLDLCQCTIFRSRLFGYAADAPSDAEIETVVRSAVRMFIAAYRTR